MVSSQLPLDIDVVDGHPIPPELIYQGLLHCTTLVFGYDLRCATVFKHAAREQSMALTLCLVCRTALDYILPELYRNVTLSSAAQVISFHSALYRSQMGAVEGERGFLARESKLPGIVRTLWLGPRSCFEMQGLNGSSAYRHITIIHHIFSMCIKLQSVSMVNLEQNMWSRLEDLIPSSVATLYLGPINGFLNLRTMRCFSNLHSIISVNAYMPDWEVKDIITLPHCRRFCRFFQWSPHVDLAFKQLECLAQASGLEDMQIVIFGHGDFEKKVAAMIREHEHVLKDKRVSITCWPSSHRDWMECLYNRWTTEV